MWASFLLTSVRTGCWSPPRKCAPLRTSGRKRPLSGTQHSFHETKRETLNRARPQVVTSRDNRLTDTSRDGRERETQWTLNTSLPVKKCWHRQSWLPGEDRPCLFRMLNEKKPSITYPHCRQKLKRKNWWQTRKTNDSNTHDLWQETRFILHIWMIHAQIKHLSPSQRCKWPNMMHLSWLQFHTCKCTICNVIPIYVMYSIHGHRSKTWG